MLLYLKIVNKFVMVELNLENLCYKNVFWLVVLEDLFIKVYVINIRCILYYGVFF